ncbi:hypothetical protein JTE90_000736 [Oedothorax gibbosus]|uniref:Replication protein A C-terminal domain-containing protein n=1 Tax=Oedothorax gibbosus TaxID=931172 RepID=A0AAV6UQ57_9ARAC|nr:hypothetical protein JTE90_000736 [Oedothorax gibbosus]
MWGAGGDGGFGGKGNFEQSGGGFLNTTVSSPSTSDKKKPERLTNVMPITIAQIHLMQESDEHLSVGSVSAKIVTFVALVQTVDVQTTKVTYVVSDFTSPSIEVHLWIGESDDQSKLNIMQENTYARVTGAVRSMKGKRHVMAFNIRPLTDLSELTMHMAEVIHSSMAIQIRDKENATASTATGFGSTSMLTSGMDTSDTFASNTSSKLSKPQQLVRQAIINCKDEQGIAVSELYNSLKSLSRQSIQEALDFLSNEGHIYSTIDEDHYKSTDCV